MRAAPAPPITRARQGAVQSTSSAPSNALLTKRGSGAQGSVGSHTLHYQDWQETARTYARKVGFASFPARVVSDCIARVDVFVSRQVAPDEWERVDDPRFDGIFQLYRNPLQGPDELLRLHAWHYNIAGEGLIVQRDSQDGRGNIEYGIYSTVAAMWDKPDDGLVTVQLAPDGKVDKGTGFVVPRDQVVRFWLPDEEWQALATSPMAASVDDIRRYVSLARYANVTADSALAMLGVLWAPGEAFEPMSTPDDDAALDSNDLGEPKYALEEQYYQLARQRLDPYNDDVASIAPPLWHWDKDYGKPEWVKAHPGLDEQGIAHRKEALEDFARSSPLPVSTLVGGGVGDANHWSEWLASKKVWDSGVAPTADRIFHLDLTRTFLWPRARAAGIGEDDLLGLRLDYDPTPVIAEPDNSENAIKLLPTGAVSFKAVLEACGFDEADAMSDPAEKEWLLEVLSRGAAGQAQEGPITPASTVQAPPSPANNVTPLTPGAQAASVGVLCDRCKATTRPHVRSTLTCDPTAPWHASAGLPDPMADSDETAGPTPARTRRAIAQLTRLRGSLGTRLLAEAQHAYQHALTAAGVKVTGRARNRNLGIGRQASLAQAVADEQPLAPWLGAVGITDLELLDHAFDTFRTRAAAELARYRERSAAVLERAGLPVPSGPYQVDDAVSYLIAGLTAMARQRLLSGTDAVLAAVAPSMIPRARRAQPSTGFDLPGLPNPDDLASAAARLVRNAIGVADGRQTMRLPVTPDQLPEVSPRADVVMVEEQLALTLEVQPIWRWAHGFYGEPPTVFEPHLSLDGYETTDRDGDPILANDGDWPESKTYTPGDHVGCTCEWVLG